jgi:hypothetical protein
MGASRHVTIKKDPSASTQVPPSPLELLGVGQAESFFKPAPCPCYKSGAGANIRDLFPCRPKLEKRLRLPSTWHPQDSLPLEPTLAPCNETGGPRRRSAPSAATGPRERGSCPVALRSPGGGKRRTAPGSPEAPPSGRRACSCRAFREPARARKILGNKHLIAALGGPTLRALLELRASASHGHGDRSAPARVERPVAPAAPRAPQPPKWGLDTPAPARRSSGLAGRFLFAVVAATNSQSRAT